MARDRIKSLHEPLRNAEALMQRNDVLSLYHGIDIRYRTGVDQEYKAFYP
jgi:hypothetical protein